MTNQLQVEECRAAGVYYFRIVWPAREMVGEWSMERYATLRIERRHRLGGERHFLYIAFDEADEKAGIERHKVYRLADVLG